MNGEALEKDVSMDTAGFQYAVRIALKADAVSDAKDRIRKFFDNCLGTAEDLSKNPDEMLFAGDEPLWNCLGEGM